MTPSEASPVSDAVRAYSGAFLQRFPTKEATSPFGTWLLLALLAPAARGSARVELEAAAGADTETLSHMVASLLARPHPALANALAVWAREPLLNDSYRRWSQGLPAHVQQGPIPSVADADRWASEATGGMVESFPALLDELTALVLASALATDVSWHVPYQVTAAAALGGVFGSVVNQCLVTTQAQVARTEAAGLVAVHRNRAASGIEVLSVIGAEEVDAVRMHRAALEVQAAAASDRFEELVVPVTELDLGVGGAWSVSEVDGPYHRAVAWLPAWEANEDPFDLDSAPGMGAALATVSSMLVEPRSVEAVQKVFARYDTVGFKAAAVTAITARAAGLPPKRRVRLLEIRFNRPYAVVASTVNSFAKDSPYGAVPSVGEYPEWDGVPVFAGWVSVPIEPGPLD